ncbi:hypothetical protein LABALGLTS371_15490 [Dellaglioa algida]|uniref:Uncharacterized protein n=1 Tax=Dellaglioa algida TaxID=105612 RepID=A0A5C6M7S0_9LACO|nr:hypothetical protein [Dellaglioa algida]MDK1716409.1 hypothetical protein [Dellaglioa algida]MDK1720237.1 hypothetical protein [Dellaglioa algida]MDK1721351.1 hypothetical protein [Dellaglioa algida]TWW10213.1 hypothetical protein LABALGLTS371_15490 [Dellaglioa algida]
MSISLTMKNVQGKGSKTFKRSGSMNLQDTLNAIVCQQKQFDFEALEKKTTADTINNFNAICEFVVALFDKQFTLEEMMVGCKPDDIDLFNEWIGTALGIDDQSAKKEDESLKN